MTDTTTADRAETVAPVRRAPMGWPISKRLFHWTFAIACIVALTSAKPPEPNSFIHIIAGTIALAMGLGRILWRLLSDIRPRLRDGLKFSRPSASAGAIRGWGRPVNQLMRLLGFVLLFLVPVACLFAVFGMTTSGEESDLLELHEAIGQVLKPLIPAHIVLAVLYGVLMRAPVFRMTITRRGNFLEGGKRGGAAFLAGLVLTLASLAWIWGPHDISARFTAFQQAEHDHGDGENGDRDHDERDEHDDD